MHRIDPTAQRTAPHPLHPRQLLLMGSAAKRANSHLHLQAKLSQFLSDMAAEEFTPELSVQRPVGAHGSFGQPAKAD